MAGRDVVGAGHDTFRTRIWLPAVEASGVGFQVRMHDLRHAHAIAPDQAFDVLRKSCRRNGLRHTDVANRVISDPASVQDLMAH